MKNTIARISPTSKRIHAMFAAVPATPETPRIPATIATTRKNNAQYSIPLSFKARRRKCRRSIHGLLPKRSIVEVSVEIVVRRELLTQPAPFHVILDPPPCRPLGVVHRLQKAVEVELHVVCDVHLSMLLAVSFCFVITHSAHLGGTYW